MKSIRSPEPIIGIWQHMPVPMISRYLAMMGWDWVVLDMQHSPPQFETAYECFRILSSGGVMPIVRTSIGTPAEVERALDLGARGVVVPMVNSVAEAEAMAHSAKYPPLGRRSMGSDNPWHYGDDYFERANEETLLLVQVEHINAVNVVEQTMALPGVDGCFIGPTDLALSMGLARSGFEGHPEHRAAVARTLAACKKHGKLACTNTYNMAEARQRLAEGFGCITLKSEADLFMAAGRSLLGELRGLVGG